MSKAMSRALAVSVLTVLPVFLVGALSVQISTDLRVTAARVGLVASAIFAVAGILARPLSSLVQRCGVRLAVTAAATSSGAALVCMGLARHYLVILLATLLAGTGNALGQPAANLALSRSVSMRRLGLAFGLKQSAAPLSTLLGGMAVPGVALLVGWRWAFLGAASMAAVVAVWVICDSPGSEPAFVAGAPRPSAVPRLVHWLSAIAYGFGAASTTSLGVFIVSAGVAAGLGASVAGVVAGACALVAVSARLTLGWWTDLRGGVGAYALIATLLLVGTCGYAFLGTDHKTGFIAAAFIAFGAGWAWPGLFHFAVVRDNRATAASATGFIQAGSSLGAAAGPVVFGYVVEIYSYRTAWIGAGAASFIAGLLVLLARQSALRARPV